MFVLIIEAGHGNLEISWARGGYIDRDHELGVEIDRGHEELCAILRHIAPRCTNCEVPSASLYDNLCC